MKNNFQNIIDLVKDKNNFAIIAHTSPDGDCMGSMLGLYNSLISMKKCVDVYMDDEIPERLSILNDLQTVKNTLQNQNYDIIFALDCGDKKRLGRFADELFKKGIVINIDHHISNEMYGDINYVDSNASSVGEIIYNLLNEGDFPINKEVATCLYVSIISDTGGFKYSNTHPSTFIAASELIKHNINHSKIYSKLFDEKTKSQVQLLSEVTRDLNMHFEDKVAILSVTLEMLESLNAKDNESGDLVNVARDIDTVEVGILLKQKEEKLFKVSLRSKEYVDVRLVAEKFNGGGHIRAAGCAIEGSLDEVKEKLLKEIKGQIK